MVSLKDKTCLVYDSGTNVDMAIKLSETFGTVLYYSQFEEAYPNPYKHRIGTGFEEITRIDSIWPYFDNVHLWVFPHLFQGSFQEWLRAQGKIVFGAGNGERLELYRDEFKLLQKELGMPLNNYEVIHGMDNLFEHLKSKEDVYIKNNIYRGIMETWHHDTFDVSKPYLDFLRSEYGMYQNEEKFIVEEPIKDAVEYGYDGFCIDGKYPDKTIFGIEVKDTCYVCCATSYKKLPKAVLDANKKLSPMMEYYNYRGWYSNEMRSIGLNKAILTDMTTRSASPPTALALEMFENFGLYVWQVANGEIPEVDFKYKYGCQIIMSSEWARKEPLAIYFPEKYRKHVKIKNVTKYNGVHYFLPQEDELIQVGSVIGMGNTLREAIDQAKGIAKEVKGYCLNVDGDCLDATHGCIRELRAMDIDIL